MRIEKLRTGLKALTPQELSDRAVKSWDTRGRSPSVCKQGHIQSGENVRLSSTGVRVCIPCKSETQRRYRIKKRGQQ
jgi:hypothetical protein